MLIKTPFYLTIKSFYGSKPIIVFVNNSEKKIDVKVKYKVPSLKLLKRNRHTTLPTKKHRFGSLNRRYSCNTYPSKR